MRDGTRAAALVQQLERLPAGEDPALLATLAAAYAETGRFPEAVTTRSGPCALPPLGATAHSSLRCRPNSVRMETSQPYRESTIGAE
jgi:hypothetical protein